ncbi:MAG: DNA primase [Clostridia bacterium]|nr:DNA primase [Clostridia bacterium]
MAIPEQVISEIKYRNDIENVISPYVNLKRRGKNLVGLCPFHSEKTPSFTVYPENGSFYCFGCGVGGDIFTFTGLIENLDYIESVKLLAEKSGISIVEDNYDNSMQKLKNTIYEINKETARFYHSYMMTPEGKWGLDYFTRRGLSLKTIKHFGLGCAPDGWDNLIKHLKAKGFSIGDMLAANVIGKSSKGTYYDRFRKRYMFPIINIRGNIIGFSGRALPEDEKKGGKYVNTSDTPVYKKSENLFAMNYAKNHCSEQIILVEGNMDVIALHQAGFPNTVAALGTSFTKEQVNLISRYSKEIVLTLDADAAGQKAVARASELLKNSGLSVKVLVLPEGKDPDEFLRKNSPEKFKGLLEKAVNIVDYKLLTAAKGIDTQNENSKLEYINKAVAIIADTDDVLARDLYIGKLSEKYGITRLAITSKVEELRKTKARQKQKKEISEVITPRYSRDDINPERRNSPKATAAEETLIAILLRHPDFFEEAYTALPPEKMVTALNRRIYQLLSDTIRSGKGIDISYFSDRLLPAELGYLVALQNGDKAGENPKIVLKDCIKVILEEEMLKTNTNSKDLSVEDWANNLKNIIDTKNKGEN